MGSADDSVSSTRQNKSSRANHCRNLGTIRGRRLTVKLRGRTTTPASGRGPAISTGSRGRKPPTPHGPLQRLLEGTLKGGRRGVTTVGRYDFERALNSWRGQAAL